jgi:hypothetical protein
MRKPVKLGPMRLVDVAGGGHRLTWTAHMRRQYVEVLTLTKVLKNGLRTTSLENF